MSKQVYKSVADIPGLGVPEYAQPERIFFKMRTIQRLAALAGYHGVVTITGHTGDTTEQSIAIGGAITGGSGGVVTAAASVANVRRAGLGKAQHEDAYPNCHHRTSLTLSVNTQRIHEDVQGRERQPKAWARALHTAVGGLLVKEAWQHLVRDNVAIDKAPAREVALDVAFHVGTQMVVALVAAGAEVSIPENIGYQVLVYGLVAGLSNAERAEEMAKARYRARESCFSALPVMHLDRVALVWLGSHIPRLTQVATPAA